MKSGYKVFFYVNIKSCTQISAENGKLKEEKEAYQATIEEQNTSLEDMNSQYAALQSERDSLQQQVDAKKVAEEQAAREAAAQELAESQGGETVYWVPNGKVYHSTINCPSLGRSKTIYHGTIAESGKPRGCKNCY